MAGTGPGHRISVHAPQLFGCGRDRPLHTGDRRGGIVATDQIAVMFAQACPVDRLLGPLHPEPRAIRTEHELVRAVDFGRKLDRARPEGVAINQDRRGAELL